MFLDEFDKGVRGVFLGLVLGIATAVGLVLLPLDWARGAIANLLTLIVAIYVGFALAARDRATNRCLRCICTVGGTMGRLVVLGSRANASWWMGLLASWDTWGRGGPGLVCAIWAVYDLLVLLFVAICYALPS